MATIERFFPADHPVGDGHFPGNPIIPGALLLGEVLLAIEAETGMALSPGRIKSAKFFYPTRPGERVAIEFTHVMPTEIKFVCTVEGKTVLTGQVECAAPPTTK